MTRNSLEVAPPLLDRRKMVAGEQQRRRTVAFDASPNQ
jgi:hypothetical protein